MPVLMHPEITFAFLTITSPFLPMLMDSQLSPFVFFVLCSYRNFQMNWP